MNGIDYSWARPGGAAIKAAGFDFVARYVPYPGDTGKGLDVAELADLRANGLGVGLVFESTANRALEGFTVGIADALTCLHAVKALGFPDSRPIYFAVDFDAQPGQYSVIDAYLQGAASVMGFSRIGVYGSYNVVKHCADYGTARWFWQAKAWSGGHHFEGRHLYQSEFGQFINGGEVDFNVAYAADFGQWPAEESMADLAEVIQMLGGMDAVRAWNAKGNIGLLPAFAAEQKLRGETTNAVNSRVKLLDDHIANHGAQNGQRHARLRH